MLCARPAPLLACSWIHLLTQGSRLTPSACGLAISWALPHVTFSTCRSSQARLRGTPSVWVRVVACRRRSGRHPRRPAHRGCRWPDTPRARTGATWRPRGRPPDHKSGRRRWRVMRRSSTASGGSAGTSAPKAGGRQFGHVVFEPHVAPDQVTEVLATQLPDGALGPRPNRGGAGHLVEEGNLAEEITRLEEVRP